MLSAVLGVVTCAEAARNGHCSTLRWLRQRGCPWRANNIHATAAQGGSVEAFVFLQQQGIVFTSRVLRQVLRIAGACNKLAAAKWLRQQGAQWPAALRWTGKVWPDDALEWARAEGCISPIVEPI
jgi:hypothetical protein